MRRGLAVGAFALALLSCKSPPGPPLCDSPQLPVSMQSCLGQTTPDGWPCAVCSESACFDAQAAVYCVDGDCTDAYCAFRGDGP